MANQNLAKSLTPQDDPSASPTAYVILIFVAIFVITLIALQALYDRAKVREEVVKVVDRPAEPLLQLKASQTEQISEYRWVDRDAQVVAIPIDRAMELTARDLAEANH